MNQIDEQLGGPRSLLKAAYEVDKLLTAKENSWSIMLFNILKP